MYEYKSYKQWLREDAKGWKRQVFLVTSATRWVGGLCVLVYYVLLALGVTGVSKGYSPINLLLVIGIGIVAISLVAHIIVDLRLTREYWNYAFPNLSKISKW